MSDHEQSCDKICDRHEGTSNRLTTIEAGGKVVVAIGAVVCLLLSILGSFAYTTLAAADADLKKVQSTHASKVDDKTEEALDIVRDMAYTLNMRMAGIEREQEHIKGSNERIVGYLKVLIKERGIDLVPDGG